MQEEKTCAPWDREGIEAGKFDSFREIIAELRGENGCPWDKAQTMESLKPCLLNETIEVEAAIDLCQETQDDKNLCEELGDLLLQVVLLTQLAQEEGRFTMEDVISGIGRKMIRRHPHVFGEEASLSCMPPGTGSEVFHPDPEQVQRGSEGDLDATWSLWDSIKLAEKQIYTPEEQLKQKESFGIAAEWAADQLS